MTGHLRLLAAALALGCAAPAAAQQQAPAPSAPCGGDFGAWLAGMHGEAQDAGVGSRGLAALDAATADPRALSRDRGQAVFSQTFTQFAGRMVSGYRLKLGQANLKKYADVFARAESQFGVPAPVITAFWALETDFGAVQGDFHTLNALVTLAHDCRRPDLFRQQIVPLLKLIDRGTVPADVQGAWAGEIGQTQMLPIDYLTFGQDGDGDGKVDLRGDPADVILTTAAKIQSKGWQRGQPWIEEVAVPDSLPWDKTGRTSKQPVSQWAAWGVTKPDGSPLDENGLSAGLLLPEGHKGPAFLAYPNYDVYLEWNQSAVYSLTAGYLATRIGGAPKMQPHEAEPGLDMDAMKQLQTKLQAHGYEVGKIDGILGTATREAVRKEQMRLGMIVDGWPTQGLLAQL